MRMFHDQGGTVYVERLFHARKLFIGLMITLSALILLLILTGLAYRQSIKGKARRKHLAGVDP